jgi:hypothetical protein
MKPLPSLTDDEFAELARRACTLPDAPPALVRRAIDAWSPAADTSAAAVLQAGARTILRQLAAVLTFDSWAASPLAAGLRGPSQATRQLLFSADGRDVDLRISPAEDNRFVLTGQVFGPDEAGIARLQARPADAAAATVPEQFGALDAMGEFRLSGVAAGRYVLSLQLGDDEIVLPLIDLDPVSG